jgi:simple sugar transport system ATP-binding protein
LLEQRDEGRGVLLISEDLDELLSVADTVAVLYEGRVMGVLPAAAADIETLGLMMAGASAEGDAMSAGGAPQGIGDTA